MNHPRAYRGSLHELYTKYSPSWEANCRSASHEILEPEILTYVNKR
jgi:hypothetical protein